MSIIAQNNADEVALLDCIQFFYNLFFPCYPLKPKVRYDTTEGGIA